MCRSLIYNARTSPFQHLDIFVEIGSVLGVSLLIAEVKTAEAGETAFQCFDCFDLSLRTQRQQQGEVQIYR